MAKGKPRAVRLRRSTRKLIDTLENHVVAAFRADVAQIANDVYIGQLVEALARKDVNAAVAALNIEPAAYASLSKALRDSYEAGGRLAANLMPPLEVRHG